MLLHAQGGGFHINNGGSANLTSCQIYQNKATEWVVLAYLTFRTFLPSPRWNVARVLAFACREEEGLLSMDLQRSTTAASFTTKLEALYALVF